MTSFYWPAPERSHGSPGARRTRPTRKRPSHGLPGIGRFTHLYSESEHFGEWQPAGASSPRAVATLTLRAACRMSHWAYRDNSRSIPLPSALRMALHVYCPQAPPSGTRPDSELPEPFESHTTSMRRRHAPEQGRTTRLHTLPCRPDVVPTRPDPSRQSGPHVGRTPGGRGSSPSLVDGPWGCGRRQPTQRRGTQSCRGLFHRGWAPNGQPVVGATRGLIRRHGEGRLPR